MIPDSHSIQHDMAISCSISSELIPPTVPRRTEPIARRTCGCVLSQKSLNFISVDLRWFQLLAFNSLQTKQSIN